MPITIYDKHHLRTQQPQLRYFCETRGPGRTIHIPRGHDRISLLSLSAEIRNLIYEYAITIDETIGFEALSHNRPALLSEGWRQRKELTACFNLLLTCKSIYAEAKPVFWGQNAFELQVTVVGYVPCHPAPQVWSPTRWKKWLSVASSEHRKLIKKVVVTLDEAWKQSVMPATDMQPRPDVIPAKYLLTSALDVQELAIELDAMVSRQTNIPIPDLIYQLQHDGLLNHTDVHNLLHVATDSQDADCLILYMMNAIVCMTCACCSMPKLQWIHLTGTVIVDRPNGEWKRYWNGFDVANFREDGTFASILAGWAEGLKVKFRFETPKLRSGICGRCKKEWKFHNWFPSDEQMICPDQLEEDCEDRDEARWDKHDSQTLDLQWLQDHFNIEAHEQHLEDTG